MVNHRACLKPILLKSSADNDGNKLDDAVTMAAAAAAVLYAPQQPFRARASGASPAGPPPNPLAPLSVLVIVALLHTGLVQTVQALD
ncbi:hypothetical protein DFQ27_000397 [Actinomortierella ambigua]|uniref:Uncharacterized protein n=1 Tax=Actinomortierella ambigua TaxID=1343610 RepID=A0A9P6PMK6_9FUNG|nr:hypothetical protein DFQ27_000397 [Actinomortierella ambigua]